MGFQVWIAPFYSLPTGPARALEHYTQPRRLTKIYWLSRLITKGSENVLCMFDGLLSQIIAMCRLIPTNTGKFGRADLQESLQSAH